MRGTLQARRRDVEAEPASKSDKSFAFDITSNLAKAGAIGCCCAKGKSYPPAQPWVTASGNGHLHVQRLHAPLSQCMRRDMCGDSKPQQ
jgi:hypothetical protein